MIAIMNEENNKCRRRHTIRTIERRKKTVQIEKKETSIYLAWVFGSFLLSNQRNSLEMKKIVI